MEKQLFLNNPVLGNYSLVQFDQWIGSYQVLPLQVRVDLEMIAMKEYFSFPKAPDLLQPHHQIV